MAAVYTTMTDFDGPLRMLLKKRRNGTYFALITPAHALTAATAMPTYTKRWRIENFWLSGNSRSSHLIEKQEKYDIRSDPMMCRNGYVDTLHSML